MVSMQGSEGMDGSEGAPALPDSKNCGFSVRSLERVCAGSAIGGQAATYPHQLIRKLLVMSKR